MKKSFILLFCLLSLASVINAQSENKNRFLISASWTPKFYFDVFSDTQSFNDFSLSGVTLKGEYRISDRFSIYSGYQFDQRNEPDSFFYYDLDYHVRFLRFTGIPLGLKYKISDPSGKLLFYANIGLNYTRVLQERNFMSLQDQFPMPEIYKAPEKKTDNILMQNTGLGVSYCIKERFYLFFEINYENSIVGSNSGVSLLMTDIGFSIGF